MKVVGNGLLKSVTSKYVYNTIAIRFNFYIKYSDTSECNYDPLNYSSLNTKKPVGLVTNIIDNEILIEYLEIPKKCLNGILYGDI